MYSFVIVLCCLPVVFGIVAYDCNHRNVNISTISATEVAPCIPSIKNITSSSTFIQLIQIEDEFLTHVYQCKVAISRIIMYCGMHSHSSSVRNGYAEYIDDRGSATCRDMHSTLLYRYGVNKVIGDLTANSTTTRTVTFSGSLTADGSCTGTSYSDRFGEWENVVVYGTISIMLIDYYASVSPVTDSIHLRSGVKCTYTRGYCMDFNVGETTWDPTSVEKCDSKTHTVLYQGPATKTLDNTGEEGQIVSYMLSDGPRIFALRTVGKYINCPVDISLTEHPKLLIHEKAHTAFIFNKGHISSSSLDMMAYVNTKFVFLDRTIGKSITDLYNELDYRRCLTERKALHNLLSLASINPVEFAYSYNEAPGFSAVVMGEVIHIIKCQPVEVSVRKSNRCYHELPVNYSGKELYMMPRSRLLQQHGTEVTCDTLLSSEYNLNGAWYGVNPVIHAVTPPNVLQPQKKGKWEYISPRTLATSGIYTDQDLENLRTQLLHPNEHAAIQNILTRGAAGLPIDLQGIDMSKVLTDDALDGITNSISTRIWGWFSSLGQICSGLLGIYVVVKSLKFIVDTLIHAQALHSIFGFGYQLIAAIWSSMTHYLIYRHHKKKVKKSPDNSASEKDEEAGEHSLFTAHEKNLLNTAPTDPNAAANYAQAISESLKRQHLTSHI